jgi:hypothetical protein
VTTTPPPNKKEREAAAERAIARDAAQFVKRRPLDRDITVAAAGAGLVAGLMTAYLAAIWLARAPLDPEGRPSQRPVRTLRRRPRA